MSKALRVSSVSLSDYLDSNTKAIRVYDVNGGGNPPDLSDIKARLGKIETTLSNLLEEISVLDNVRKRLAKAEENVASNITKLSDIDNRLEQVDHKFVSVDSEVIDLGTKVDALTKVTDGLSTRVDAVKAKAESIGVDLAKHEFDFGVFKEDLSEAFERLVPLTDFTDLKNSVDDLKSKSLLKDSKFGLTLDGLGPFVGLDRSTGFVTIDREETFLNRTFMGTNNLVDYECPCSSDTTEPFSLGFAITDGTRKNYFEVTASSIAS